MRGKCLKHARLRVTSVGLIPKDGDEVGARRHVPICGNILDVRYLDAEKEGVHGDLDRQAASNGVEPRHVILHFIITHHVTAIDGRWSVGSWNAWNVEPVLATNNRDTSNGGINKLATIKRFLIRVHEARETNEIAFTKWSRWDDVVITEDGASGHGVYGSSNRHSKIDVEMMTEESWIHLGLLIHDAAVHKVPSVDKDAIGVNVAVLSTFTTVLPFTINIGAVGASRASRASVLAHVLARTRSDIEDATVWLQSVNARESIAVDAVIVTGLRGINRGLTAVPRVTVAVGVTGVANEYAITTGGKVSCVTIAIGINSCDVNVPAAIERGIAHVEAIPRRGARRNGSVKLITSIEVKSITEIVAGLRAKIILSTARIRGSSLTDSAPALVVFTTVARI